MKNQIHIHQKENARFISIDVGQGDSFYLEKNNISILVDGGKSEVYFPGHFKKVVNKEHVDILVCTHNDADHAQGILGFLRSSLTCKEVWLPGSWTTRLTDLLLHPGKFIFTLYNDIASLETTSVEDIITNPTKEDTPQNFRLDDNYNNSFECIYDAIEHASSNEDSIPWTDFFIFPTYLIYHLEPHKKEMFFDALNSAKRIRNIAIAAYHKGVTIRWFEYNKEYCSGGNPGILEPINSKEIVSIPPYKPSVFEYINLSKSNKESLVFLSPFINNVPAVLFSADSDFSFSQTIKWSDKMLITAPHHGSESNRNAYQRYYAEAQEFQNIKWIRSDGKFKKRPGKSYLSLNDDRYCTQCRNEKTAKNPAVFSVEVDGWITKRTTTCTCI
ncbi:hypothetical protein ACIG6B_25970 [Bacillus mobilis]|uniref:hypothetical protein n=1 Tax=Bacillus mobilis TaxID=2026190 RepID=UPI00363C9A38